MCKIIRYDADDPTAMFMPTHQNCGNSITGQFVDEIQETTTDTDANQQTTRVVDILITGTERGFCSSTDISRLKKLSEG